ncbi:DUF2523 family protein [Acinetobacter guillouiae]|jgi:hypothetical protein|uniref:DUF2523 family protein n=1 Tax=Acinetobacter guillouiae TaxID=106649 RepID=UPI003AF43F41
MGKLLVLIGGWLLDNFIRRILAGAGLAVVSYLGVLALVRTAFDSIINNLYSTPGVLLSMMGMLGIDHVLGSFISVAIFLITLDSGKLMLRKK